VANIDTSTLGVQDELSAAGAIINGRAQAIEEELNALMRQLAPLQYLWTGGAADGHAGYQTEWNNAALGLFGPDGVLGTIARAMGVVWENYSDCESANIQSWQNT
jgi:uncharacterized protein YukE